MSGAGVLRILEGDRLGFWCPGCAEMHVVNIDASDRPAWSFNGNYDAPTFTPSILVRGTRRITDDEHVRIMAGEKIEPVPRICHSFVTDGVIRFLDDCTHALVGRSVKLTPPNWNEVPG